MKKLLALILGVLAVAGCRTLAESAGRTFDPARPQITVTPENRLVVNQEPIVVPRRGVDWTITWQLPRDGKARFLKEKGITIELLDKLLGPDGNPVRDSEAQVARINRELGADPARERSIFGCKFRNEYEYECVIPSHIKQIQYHGLFSYTIRVTIDGKLVISDPRVMY
jgi:hypothetical protein